MAKHRPIRDPKFHSILKFGATGMSTSLLLTGLDRGPVFRWGILISL